MNKKVSKELREEKKKKEKYKKELKKVKKIRKLAIKLDKLDKVARRFFEERLGISVNLNYLEISKKARKGSVLEEFSNLMLNLMYKGLELTEKRMEQGITLFERLISEQT
ncbi:hypothetical protein K9M41_04560 [Candidatus Gracilibacteria bacterium]|nr:hypothetical protein [Candidatus Gracilibacteria bacterium]